MGEPFFKASRAVTWKFNGIEGRYCGWIPETEVGTRLLEGSSGILPEELTYVRFGRGLQHQGIQGQWRVNGVKKESV